MASNKPKSSIVIIGNGISGITTARHIRKQSNVEITIISDESPYFFSRTALMYVYMGHMKFEHTQPYENNFWEKNKISLVHKRVAKLISEKHMLAFEDGSSIVYDKLVIATGSKPNRFGWPGQNLKAVQGLYHKQDLEQLEAWSGSIKSATIVGGGLIGIELAEMLHSRGKKVHFLVRESSFWNAILPEEESEMINQHIRLHGIDLQLETELKGIESNEEGRAKGVHTTRNEFIECQWVGLTVGVSPNIDFLKNSSLETGKGIKVNSFLETNLPHVYAIGDCAEQTEPLEGRHPIEAVWYTGRMMGETLAKTLVGEKTKYVPGNWFNSAKFFDIEYQTYGTVTSTPVSEEEQHLFWKHPKKNNSIRLSFNPSTNTLLGCITMGVRLRHSVFDEWLTNKEPMDSVIKNFKTANFDPEFYPTYEKELTMEWETLKRHNNP